MLLQQIILTGGQIICSKIVTVDIMLPAEEFFFLKGIVYSPTGEPLPNAAVEVKLVDHVDSVAEKSLGVTFTENDGSYGISLAKINGKQYKLIAYSQ
ncbi:hypothetical protein C8E03_10252 [Lachnotalea glycerini]|uniref:Carboxypeptidase regulatory-like domain-containing protein n=1 Tax=Lachnotalea glycerini TaxID=1763509 RepID=A0A318EP97_9FIRM|nr:hypothetical protein [Lachnotalea glycerini]OYO67805.1 hypothetical protein CG709_17065 [Lachnotalea glycerini]PXV93285.1 hypothetical protein C8E03_10252 [Lachnotalea glycerini]RDY31897.1 hypothetical protein CG710_007055 [Lachnotalea glycerini]